jgi:hypothetical protein
MEFYKIFNKIILIIYFKNVIIWHLKTLSTLLIAAEIK